MVKNTKQIALIQNRRGRLSELPTQLNDGEFGLATDTNELFIGNGSNPALAERVAENKFPWGNVQILTEFTDNLKIITYRYESNTDISARLPIIITSQYSNSEVYANTSIKINDVEVLFDRRSTDINYIIETINNTEGLNVKAFNNNGRLSMITTDTELTLEDTEKTYQGIGLVEWLGFGEDGFYSAVSGVPSERSLQDVLDDFVSAKSYDITGNGEDDDSEAIYNAIISLNKAGDAPEYYRTLLFPAGTYLISSKTIPLPYGTHIKGEGMGRTVFKAKELTEIMMTTMNGNMVLGTDDTYKDGSKIPHYITVEDLTIDASEANISTLVKLNSCENVEFKNVEFISSTNALGINFVGNSRNILLDHCLFNGTRLASNESLEHLVVRHCSFEDSEGIAINLNPTEGNEIFNSILDGNTFSNTSLGSESVIYLGSRTSFINVTNSRFDKDIAEGNITTKPYISLSDLNYTDTLDASTDTKKLLQFRFTQPMWEYVDYLMNPHGEYILKSIYNTSWIDGEEQASHLTNGLVLEQGDSSNNNTVTLGSSETGGNVNINAGSYGTLQLGKNISATTYEDWVPNYLYSVGDIIQYDNGDGTFKIYSCIKGHQSDYDDIIYDESGNFVSYDETLWELIGDYSPMIETYKNIDLKNHYITDTVSNITFKTDDNIMIIDDSYDSSIKGDKSYAQRIAPNPMAIPNVDYVNTIAQSTVRKTFNYDVITDYQTSEESSELPTSSRKEIFWFDPSIYSDFVSLNYVNINVRRPFYPIMNSLSEAFEWKPGNKYYIGEIVKTNLADTSRETPNHFAVLTNGAWQDKTLVTLTENNMDSFVEGVRKPKSNYGSAGTYAIWYEPNQDYMRYVYYKVNANTWVNVESSDYANLYSSYAQGQSGKTCQVGAIFELNGTNITLTSENTFIDVNTAVNIINEKETLTGVHASNQSGALRLYQSTGVINMRDINLNPLESFGFKVNLTTFNFEISTAKLIITTDGVQPSLSYVNGSIWLDTTGTLAYLVCRETHIAKDNIYEDMGSQGSYIVSKWQEVFQEVVDVKDYQTKTPKDLKYVSIIAMNSDTLEDPTIGERRLIFSKNIIDVSKRNINSVYELPWTRNKAYNIGDRCLSHGRYWECLKAHTSSNEDELHNKDLWVAVSEEGYNYHFDFERNIYMVDANGNIIPSDDTIINYDYSDYHLFLVLYDDTMTPQGIYSPEELILFETDDLDRWGNKKRTVQVNPNGYMLITINYIRTAREEL